MVYQSDSDKHLYRKCIQYQFIVFLITNTRYFIKVTIFLYFRLPCNKLNIILYRNNLNKFSRPPDINRFYILGFIANSIYNSTKKIMKFYNRNYKYNLVGYFSNTFYKLLKLKCKIIQSFLEIFNKLDLDHELLLESKNKFNQKEILFKRQ